MCVCTLYAQAESRMIRKFEFIFPQNVCALPLFRVRVLSDNIRRDMTLLRVDRDVEVYRREVDRCKTVERKF